ncbi:MAG: hypothetical protein FH761_15750 [Firmicutes bacterium]|nr:hypothetical protein [Bacillota bacterium]
MNKKKYFYIVAILLIVIFFLIFRYINTIDYKVSKSKIAFDDILYIEKEVNEQIVLYSKHLFENGEYGLGINVFKKSKLGWITKLDTSQKMDSLVTFNYLHLQDKKTLIYGYINENSVSKIKIFYKNYSEFAEIIETDWKKIWMHEIKDKNFYIEVYDNNNKVIYTINTPNKLKGPVSQ